MINSTVILKGNIGQIEASYTPQGKFICKFSIAVNIGYGENKETNWYKCVAWEKSGELINQFAQKGTSILVIGRQKIVEWAGKDGNKGVSVEVTVQDFEVLARGKKKDEAAEDEPEFMKDSPRVEQG